MRHIREGSRPFSLLVPSSLASPASVAAGICNGSNIPVLIRAFYLQLLGGTGVSFLQTPGIGLCAWQFHHALSAVDAFPRLQADIRYVLY